MENQVGLQLLSRSPVPGLNPDTPGFVAWFAGCVTLALVLTSQARGVAEAGVAEGQKGQAKWWLRPRRLVLREGQYQGEAVKGPVLWPRGQTDAKQGTFLGRLGSAKARQDPFSVEEPGKSGSLPPSCCRPLPTIISPV